MECICCRSNDILKHPIKLDGFYGCRSCGLIFKNLINTIDVQDDLRKHYQQTDPHESVARSKQLFFNKTLDILSVKNNFHNKSILDVGCGYGYFLELAAKRGWNVSGVEIAKNAVQHTRDKLGCGDIFHGVLENANYPKNTFDAITLWDLLDFVEDPFKELTECFRILKEGGNIGIRVRNIRFQKLIYRVFSLFKWIAWGLGVKTPYVFHPYCFTGKSLDYLLKRIGFTNIKISNSPLTRGDPYVYTGISGLTSMIKRGIEIVSNCLFFLSGKRWIVGPSILVWAEKPVLIKKTNQPE